MSDEQLFRLANACVMPAWLLLAVAPRWLWTRRLVHSALYPIVLGIVYTVGLLLSGPGSDASAEGAGLSSLAGIYAAFSNPRTLLVAWVHYLVFDLFVGAWQARDALRRGIPHWVLVPCLFLTLMAGPMGLLAYLAIRFLRTRNVSLADGEFEETRK
jgi:Domain of unknown function (DUF4281)